MLPVLRVYSPGDQPRQRWEIVLLMDEDYIKAGLLSTDLVMVVDYRSEVKKGKERN